MPIAGLRGRHIATLLTVALMFWARHKATLESQLTPEIVGALDLLLAALPVIQALNKPGPE